MTFVRSSPQVQELAAAPGPAGPHRQGQLPPLSKQRKPQIRCGTPCVRRLGDLIFLGAKLTK